MENKTVRTFKFKVTRMSGGELRTHYVECQSFDEAKDVVEQKYNEKGCVICVKKKKKKVQRRLLKCKKTPTQAQ